MVYVSQAFYLLVNESFEGLDIVATRRDEQLIEIKIPPNRAKALIGCWVYRTIVARTLCPRSLCQITQVMKDTS